MSRTSLVVVATAALLSVGIGVSTQTASPQPSQPAAGVAPTTNQAPTVSLSTEPAKQVFGTGERLVVVANAADAEDSPERLHYQWTVKNLDTGVEKPARSTALRKVQTTLRVAGKYEFKCVVTDTSGQVAQATLAVVIEDAGDPEIAAVAFDESTAALHRVAPYWREGYPAIRRGDWARLTVSVRNFIAGAHYLKVLVDGKPVAPAEPGSPWAVQNLGGSMTERHLQLFVPPDAAVGKHAIEVAVFRRGTDGGADVETGRTRFSPEPLVLFNPWRAATPDPAVYGGQPLSPELATFHTRGTQALLMRTPGSEGVFDVTPHSKDVVKMALDVVAGLPQDARGDASRIATEMAANVASRAQADAEPARSAAELTSLLRSIGIPARIVTVTGAGHDAKYECRRWTGGRCDDPQAASSPEHLGSRPWVEVWNPSTGGWTAVDAKAFDDASRRPWEISWKAPDNNWYKASGETATTARRLFAKPGFEPAEEPSGTGAPAAGSALQITVEPVLNLQSAAIVKVSGTGAAPARLGVAVLRMSQGSDGGGLVFASVVESKASGSWNTSLEVPGTAFSRSGAYEIVAGPQQSATGPSGRTRVDVRGLPIAVALPAKVASGTTFALSARLVNSTNTPVNGAALRLVLPSQLKLVGGTDSGSQAVIPPGGGLRVDATVQAVLSGTFLAGASSDSSAGSSAAHAPVTVTQPGRVFLAGVPALGVTVGTPVTVTADVMLDAVEPSGEAEVELGPVHGPEISIMSDARKTTATLTADDRWTPSWQVQVNTPGTYRLPVRVGVAAVGEARGEIVLVAGAADPDENAVNDFEEEGTLGYRSVKAMAGVGLAAVALVVGAVYWVRRRSRLQ